MSNIIKYQWLKKMKEKMYFCTFCRIMLGIEIEKKRIFGLDFLRAFAILCVVHAHGSHLLNDSFSHLTRIPLPHGVDMFFVISGFLIGTSFLKYSEHNGIIDSSKTLRFYGRTALRILPNYYVIMVIYYFLVQGGIVNGNIHEFPLWRFATFTQNFATPFYNFYWESWSLSVQIWFYIMFPLILMILSKHIKVKKATLFISLFFITSSLVFRYIEAAHASDKFWWDVWMRKTVMSRFDNIYIGVIAAWIKFYYPEFWKKNSIKCLIIGIIIMIVTFIIPREMKTFYTNVIYLSIAPVAIAMWFPFATSVKESKTFIGQIISHFSILSYAMFLVNLMIVQIIDNNFADYFKQIGAEGYGIYWIVVIVASYILYIAVEKQFVKIRDKVM